MRIVVLMISFLLALPILAADTKADKKAAEVVFTTFDQGMYALAAGDRSVAGAKKIRAMGETIGKAVLISFLAGPEENKKDSVFRCYQEINRFYRKDEFPIVLNTWLKNDKKDESWNRLWQAWAKAYTRQPGEILSRKSADVWQWDVAHRFQTSKILKSEVRLEKIKKRWVITKLIAYHDYYELAFTK